MEYGFTQVVEEQKIALDSISNFIGVDKGESIILEYQIPEFTFNNELVFYSKDLEVEVFVDDELIYNFQMEDKFEFLKTPGNIWNVIEITTDMIGETLRIELTSNFNNRYQSTCTNIYLINKNEILNVIFAQDSFRVIMSIILLVMSLFVYINVFIWQRERTRKFFLHLGNLYFCVAMWVMSMYGAFDYFIKRPIFSYLISMFMSAFIPVAFCGLIKSIYTKKSYVINLLEYVVWGNFIIQLILQFVFKVSLLDLLSFSYVVYGAGAIICIFLIIYNIKNHMDNLNFQLVSMIIIFLGVVFEIITLCVLPKRIDLIGFSGLVGLVMYLVVNHFNILIFESRIDIEKLALEKSYNKLRNVTLVKQIKAHFLFNTLNTISALCKYNPKEADRAITILAKYMRSYMELIDKNENIPFEKELEIVENALKIHSLRFPDTFTYKEDIEFTDFLIPPLAIQTVVENSMEHGLKKAHKQGIINISVKKLDKYIQIIVSDNGIGFDTNILSEDSYSLGLINTKNRVKLMVNGEVIIKSQIGKGTQTTFIIPI